MRKILVDTISLDVCAQVLDMVGQFGKDQDSVVNFDEFLQLMAAKMVTRDSSEEIMKVCMCIP